MLLNNLDPEVAEQPEELVVYGGSGQGGAQPGGAAGDRALAARARRRRDAARAERQAGRRLPHASGGAARADRELAARAELGDVGRVPPARGAGPDDVRPDDGGLVDLHRHAGHPPGHVPDVRRGRREALRLGRPAGRTILTAGLGGMGGAQPLAATMAGAAILCIEVDPARIERRLQTRYLDEAAESLDEALARVRAAAAEGRPLSVGLLGNAAEVVPELAAPRRALRPRHRPDGRARSAQRLRAAGARRRGGRRAARVRSGRVPAPRARVDRRATSRGSSSTSERQLCFRLWQQSAR